MIVRFSISISVIHFLTCTFFCLHLVSSLIDLNYLFFGHEEYNNLKNMYFSDVKKARLLLKSVRETNPKHPPGMYVLTVNYEAVYYNLLFVSFSSLLVARRDK